MNFGLFSHVRDSFSFIKACWQFALAALIGLWLFAPARAQNLYHVTDLGVLPGTNATSYAYGINENGQVVGQSTGTISGEDRQRAFLWMSAGGMQEVGAGYAAAINDSGQVVGQSDGRAFLWTSGAGMQDLGGLMGGSRAAGINENGQVVGESGSAEFHAFLWTSAGGVQDLGTLPGGNFSRAVSINNSGQIVGTSNTATDERAFLWTSGGGMQDLGLLPGGSNYSGAEAINDRGEVVGFSRVPGDNNHAFIWTSGGGMRDLGIVPGGREESHAFAINNSGQVVGYANVGGDLHAFLWTDIAGMRDLNGLLNASGAGWTLRAGFGINDAGKIVGWGVNRNGAERAFLLTPVGPLFAFTEFSEPALGATTYTPGATGEELGFRTVSSPTGGVNPLVGVAIAGEGSTERVLTHRSINATTTFDAVDLTNYDDIIVSMRLQVANTTYEVGDLVRVYVTNGTDTIDLVNLTAAAGADGIDDLAGDGFLGHSALIPDNWTQATLVITSSTNSSQAAERFDFDSIEFRGVVVIPEPSTCCLVVAALLFTGTPNLWRARRGYHKCDWTNRHSEPAHRMRPAR